MKGTSKVIMGATLVMVVTLAIVLALILVLLAELYCSLLLRRRKLRNTNSNTLPTTTTAATTAAAPSPSHSPLHSPPPPPFTSIYAQGVLQAPRTVLFPCTEQDMAEPKKQGIHVQTQESNPSTLSGIGLVSISPSPLSSFISRAPPKPVHQEKSSEGEEVACGGGGGEHLVYISNPIYENEEGEASGAANTPFETPESSPSHFERSCSSSGDDDDADADAAADDEAEQASPYTPPLTPMKKLPAEGSSVSLRDARSLGTSGSDSRSVNGPSSSSSASPCTSPSW